MARSGPPPPHTASDDADRRRAAGRRRSRRGFSWGFLVRASARIAVEYTRSVMSVSRVYVSSVSSYRKIRTFFAVDSDIFCGCIRTFFAVNPVIGQLTNNVRLL